MVRFPEEEARRKRKEGRTAARTPGKEIGVVSRESIEASNKRTGGNIPETQIIGQGGAPIENLNVTQEEQKSLKQEDVNLLKQNVATEEAGLSESILQEEDRVRVEREAKQREDIIKRNIKQGRTEEEANKQADLILLQGEFTKDFSLELDLQDQAISGIRGVFGDVGQSFIGLSLNQFLDQASGEPLELNEFTAQMSEAASLLPAIEGAVNNGAISPSLALAELNSAEKDAIIFRGKMDRVAVLRPDIVQSEEYLALRVELDVYEADIRDARGTALEKLRTTETQFNMLETQEYVRQLEEKKKLRR
jgi:hypothetical protein